LTGFLPALVHFLLWAVESACWVVPFSTATVVPQRLDKSVIAGPPEAFS
jgi:hypothetical protein